ncbi:hypothetical protein [Erwinia sp. S38]|uniref:hypothetical protein n=1 Tax=Erwinia sp. S38 TaxID=2769338 RepID=UPI00190E5A6F|nr:hypothetical protein [Erwinia sp. S38]
MVRSSPWLTAEDRPLVLDFDGSVAGLDRATVLPLSDWQQRVRFGASWGDWIKLMAASRDLLPERYGCVFTGSGDYHHLSYLLLQRLPADRPVQLIICDNHPDNMLYPFGIHCGSWVYHASRLPQISQIHVLGICSSDVGLSHAWENHLRPLLSKKLHYWSIGVDTRWLNWLGAGKCNHRFDNPDNLLSAFLRQLSDDPVYLSLDKDVLSKQVVQTNWDQGCFELKHLELLIQACANRLVGMDITGEVSSCEYHSRLKRWLSAGDGQQLISASEAAEWQRSQNRLNQRLLTFVQRASGG